VQTGIRIRREAFENATRHAEREPRQECCGLMAGCGGIIMNAFAATNAAADTAKNYEIAPEELFRLMREIRAAGMTLMGIYHSHPNGDNVPSSRDIERAYYPDVAYFILSPRAPVRARAFSIREGRVTELKIVVE
jgi:proteasome lid subunit RPN8/RPN11